MGPEGTLRGRSPHLGGKRRLRSGSPWGRAASWQHRRDAVWEERACRLVLGDRGPCGVAHTAAPGPQLRQPLLPPGLSGQHTAQTKEDGYSRGASRECQVPGEPRASSEGKATAPTEDQLWNGGLESRLVQDTEVGLTGVPSPGQGQCGPDSSKGRQIWGRSGLATDPRERPVASCLLSESHTAQPLSLVQAGGPCCDWGVCCPFLAPFSSVPGAECLRAQRVDWSGGALRRMAEGGWGRRPSEAAGGSEPWAWPPLPSPACLPGPTTFRSRTVPP